MITITTALYCEALPFITKLNLKKDTSFTDFQVFRSEEVTLIITKPGSIQAAIGVTSACTKLRPLKSDLLLNVGVCGSSDNTVKKGSIFLCHKITDFSTKRSYYPDILYKHPFNEKSVITYPTVLSQSNADFKNSDMTFLVDMEASGVFISASYFYQPHQIFIIKIVSDYFDTDTTSPEEISQLIESNFTPIINWIKEVHLSSKKRPSTFTKEEVTLIEFLCSSLKLSVTMEHELKQILLYRKVKFDDITHILTENIKEIPLPCKTKPEGKKYFEFIKQKLI